jgi:NAD(P)-dependent dehydrogenase (short-subunit alcohol dehydrogenase family)
MNSLAGAVAVVTGGANGIGRAVCLELARAEMRVAALDLDATALEGLVAELQGQGAEAVGLTVDVRDLAAMRGAAERVEEAFGPVRLLVNNAGVGLIEPIVSITDEDWHWVMDINYFGVVNGLQAFLPGMLALDGERHVVNTASMSGLSTSRDLGGYNASKFAVVGLTEALRVELADHGIGVSMLCPGVVGTGIMGRSRRLRSQQSRPSRTLSRDREHGDWDQVRIVAPDEVAQRVMRGIANDELYLFTDPEDRYAVVARFERMLEAFDAEADSSDA